MVKPDREKIIAKVMKQIESFNENDIMELRFELEERLQSLRESSADTSRVIEEPKRTIKEQYRKCGKKNCECQKIGGKLHGPYLYEFWREGGKTHSRYIGKEKE